MLFLFRYQDSRGRSQEGYIFVPFPNAYNPFFKRIFHPDLHPDRYLHYGRTAFDTGLDLELLQEFCLIALDVFREIPYAKGEKNIRAAVLSN